MANAGRPRINLDPQEVVRVVRRLDNLTHAAEELGCSPASVANALTAAGTSLTKIRQTASPETPARPSRATPR